MRAPALFLRTPHGDLPRIRRVGRDVEDVNAVVERVFPLVTAKEGHRLTVEAEQQAIGRLHLHRPRAGGVRRLDPLQIARSAGIGDVENVPAAEVKGARVEVVAAVRDVQRHLRCLLPLQIRVADPLDVLCVTLTLGP